MYKIFLFCTVSFILKHILLFFFKKKRDWPLFICYTFKYLLYLQIKLKSKRGHDDLALIVFARVSSKETIWKLKTINTGYGEPVRDIGFRRLLKKHGTLVYLVDDFEQVNVAPLVNIVVLRLSREYQMHDYIKDKIIIKLFDIIHLGNQML